MAWRPTGVPEYVQCMTKAKKNTAIALSPDGTVKGWGGLGVPGHERTSEDLRSLTDGAVLTRGLGRAYGDAALPPPGVTEVVGTRRADRLIGFDPESGELTAEAGVSLQTLRRLFLPKGWFTPVSPGTQFVTLGGMVAADVHGKNHHVAGTFGRHVTRLVLRVADGRVVTCSPDENAELFYATQGGMGLTGHILEVSFRMERVPSPWIWQKKIAVPNIDAFVEALDQAAGKWPMTMGWIDCLSVGADLGRGVLMAGKWSVADIAPPRLPGRRFSPLVPFRMPNFLLNDFTVKAFNEAYFRVNGRDSEGIVHPEAFIYPLDAIQRWDRIYGRRGFTQHQCVIPKSAGPDAVRRYVELVASLGGSSFLCVLKDCGPEAQGMLSFPMRGISVALDLPITSDTPAVVARLNRFVRDHGGRIYLAKDAFTLPEDFRAMEGERLERFDAVRRTWDPERRIRSALSARLLDDVETNAT